MALMMFVQIDVVLEKGLSDTQYKEIISLLREQIQENVGMAMVFTLCEAVREYLVENNQKGNVRSHHAPPTFVWFTVECYTDEGCVLLL